jgi:GR25 family glycosyltransferase involved in LPS biosynthesis
MKIFVINMEGAVDRWSHYKDKKYNRWLATDARDMHPEDHKIKRMISYYNIDPKEHRAKIGCLTSHLNIWRYMVMNKMDDILILEDDADPVRDIPGSSQLPEDGVTYFGGITWSPKITDGQKKVNFNSGINKINFDEYRVLQTMSYYIPRWEIAKEMLDHIESRPRFRAIDIMMKEIPIPFYVWAPAVFVERPVPSQIRGKKNKFSDESYCWVKK